MLSFFRNFKIFKYRRGIYIYKPAVTHIHRKSTIMIDKRFHFNKSWENSLNYKLAYLKVGKNSILNVGHFVAYDGCQIDITDNAELNIGYGSYMNINSTIRCFNKIDIGSNTVISENVMIRDSDNHQIGESNDSSRPIYIGDHCWIGMGVQILKGVSIGSGSVIAAGSVIIEDVPQNSLVAGVPAKIKKVTLFGNKKFLIG